MSGVNIVRYLLANNTSLLAQVPASRIKAGPLPEGITLPAIAVTQITGNRRSTVAMNETNKLVTERVQVTLIAKDYPAKKSIMRLMEAALPNTRGTVDGINVDSIIPDAEGPDMDDPVTGFYIQTQDIIVRFTR